MREKLYSDVYNKMRKNEQSFYLPGSKCKYYFAINDKQ